MQTRIVRPAPWAAAIAAGGYAVDCMSARATAPLPDESGSKPKCVIWLNAVQSRLEGGRLVWIQPGYQAIDHTVRDPVLSAGNVAVTARTGWVTVSPQRSAGTVNAARVSRTCGV